MNDTWHDLRLWRNTGLAGVFGIVCYILAITLSWPETPFGTAAGLLVAGGMPVFCIIYSYGLYHYIGAGSAGSDGAANRLAFVFSCLAFATLLSMMVVQMAVGAGIHQPSSSLDETTARSLRSGLRLIDMGLDVAWDILIGTSLIFLGVAMRRREGLGGGWGFPAIVLGALLILLNAATFPRPPADAGLFDVGPFVGVFMLALAVRLMMLGRS